MSEIIRDDDFIIDGDCRLAVKIFKVKKSDRFSLGYKFKFQFMVFKDKWETIVRVDNSLHEDKISETHLHRYDKESVEKLDIKLEDIEKFVLNLGLSLKDKYLEGENEN